jgi:hypothetical protein
MLQYLMDDNIDPFYVKQLWRKNRDLVVWAIGEPNAPEKETLDPEILTWCEINIAFPVCKRYIIDVEKLNQQRFSCATQV